jgi:hypothetical protein
VTSKSAVGDVQASAIVCVVGASSAQLDPSQASSGKNDASRIDWPPPLNLNHGLLGSTSRQSIEITAVSPAPTARKTLSVVGFGCVAGSVRPLSRTRATVSFAPARAYTLPFGQSRNTTRSVAVCGVNVT